MAVGRTLIAILENYQNDIVKALNDDLDKPPTEAFFEIIALSQELKVAEDNLKQWMKPKKVKVPFP